MASILDKAANGTNAQIHRDTEVAIRLEHVSKWYGKGQKETVLDDLSITVARGAFVTVVGQSGLGKSTLLNMIAGLTTPNEGRIFVSGVEVKSPAPERASMVFQDCRLLPWLSALRNVAFPLEVKGVARKTRETRAMELLELVGLADMAQKIPRELSGGMQQRVAIARSLAVDPDILLMDEPFGALDEQLREDMGEALLSLWARLGKTIVFVTHSLSEAVYLGDTVWVLAKGRKVITEFPVLLGRPRPSEIIDSSDFVAFRKELRMLLR